MSDEKRWTLDHGEDSLRKKFQVIQKKTGLDLTETEFIFTLRPETDPSAYIALMLYLTLTDKDYPKRNAQVRTELQKIHDRETH